MQAEQALVMQKPSQTFVNAARHAEQSTIPMGFSLLKPDQNINIASLSALPQPTNSITPCGMHHCNLTPNSFDMHTSTHRLLL
jgi:hypothetical protein